MLDFGNNLASGKDCDDMYSVLADIYIELVVQPITCVDAAMSDVVTQAIKNFYQYVVDIMRDRVTASDTQQYLDLVDYLNLVFLGPLKPFIYGEDTSKKAMEDIRIYLHSVRFALRSCLAEYEFFGVSDA